MAKIFGQLEEAQLQNRSSDIAAATAGKLWWNTTDGQAKLDDGTNVRALLRNGQDLVIGNNATANNNVRINRSANEVLQFVLGGDTTAEGSSSANVAQLSFRAENFANSGSLPAAASAGRIAYVTGSNSLFADNGTAWEEVGSGGGSGGINYIDNGSAEVTPLAGRPMRTLLVQVQWMELVDLRRPLSHEAQVLPYEERPLS